MTPEHSLVVLTGDILQSMIHFTIDEGGKEGNRRVKRILVQARARLSQQNRPVTFVLHPTLILPSQQFLEAAARRALYLP